MDQRGRALAHPFAKTAQVDRDAAGYQRVFAGMGRLGDAGVAKPLDTVEQMKLGEVVAAFDLERRGVNGRGQGGFALHDQRGNLAIELGQVKSASEEQQQDDARGRASRTEPLERAAQSSSRRRSPPPPACASHRA